MFPSIWLFRQRLMILFLSVPVKCNFAQSFMELKEQNAPFDRNTHLIQITSVTQKNQIHKSQLNIISPKNQFTFCQYYGMLEHQGKGSRWAHKSSQHWSPCRGPSNLHGKLIGVPIKLFFFLQWEAVLTTRHWTSLPRRGAFPPTFTFAK